MHRFTGIKISISNPRAFPHSKALPVGCEATAQLRRLALSDTSIRRKRHESVMSSVMESAPNRDPDKNKNALGRKNTDQPEP
jgi:hypothetical protein